MSRRKNIITGETYMTEQNALRYYIVRADRLLLFDSNNYTRAFELYNKSKDCLDIVGCNSCDFDDIGYCYFRGKNSIDEVEQFMKHCFPCWIKSMKEELEHLGGSKAYNTVTYYSKAI